MKKIINTKNAVLAALMIVSLVSNDASAFFGSGKIKTAAKSINAADQALHMAARSGAFDRVKELVEIDKVDINEQNLKNETALMLAFDLDVLKKNRDGSWNEDQWNIVKYLIDRGANVNLKDKKGNTILHRILSSENKTDKRDYPTKLPFDQACFVALLMAGADVYAENDKKETILDSFFSVKDGRDWDSKSKIDKSSEYNFNYLLDSITLLLECFGEVEAVKAKPLKFTGYFVRGRAVEKILSFGTYNKVFDAFVGTNTRSEIFKCVRNKKTEAYGLANQKIKV